MTYDLILKNGQAVTISGIITTDIAVKNQKIVAIANNITDSAAKIIDCTGLHILPGVIDSQVHLREPGLEHKETLHTGSKAAILGGVTSVFEMPNTNPSTTTLTALQDKLERAKTMYTDHAFYVGACADNITDLPILEQQAGCAGVKIFMGSSTGNLLVSDDAVLEKVLASGRRRVAIHAEDEQRLIDRKHIADESGHVSSHPIWRDEISALQATQRIVALSYKTGRKIHILHISTAEEMAFLAEHKGGQITVEVLANHLTFHAPDCYEKLGTLTQMNPPIRDKRHLDGLWDAVRTGVVDIVATDHAPHTFEEKQKPYPNSPSGMTGLQTFVPAMLTHVADGKLTLEHLVDLWSHAPARVFGLRHKGFIRLGYDADFTIVDLKQKHTINNQDIVSKCGWTPFHGKELTGKPLYTIIRGNIVMQEGKIIGEPTGKPLVFDV